MDNSAREDWKLDPKNQSGMFLGFAHRRNIYGAQILVDKAIITVVISGPFLKNLLHNHSINIKKKISFSGEANDEANFSFFILLHKRAKPIHPPCNHFSYPNLLSTFANPPAHLYTPLVTIFHIQICYQLLQTTHSSAHLSTHTSHTARPSLRPPIPPQPTFNPSVCPGNV
jgi:hypothetical protein